MILHNGESHLTRQERISFRLDLLSLCCQPGEPLTSHDQGCWLEGLWTRQRCDQVYQIAMNKLRKRLSPELLAELKLHLPTARKPAKRTSRHENTD